jgi:acetyl esterase/lipase
MAKWSERELELEKEASEEARTQDVRVNLGLPDWLTNTFIRPQGIARAVVGVISASTLPFEVVILALWKQVPLKFRYVLVRFLWRFWCALHRLLPRKVARRGLSDSLSLEAHAISNVLWLARLTPMTLSRVRFGLNQLECNWPVTRGLPQRRVDLPERSVRGVYLTLTKPGDTPRVVMWIYGGAFVGGDVVGNLGLAEHHARALHADAFLVDVRLSPESPAEDIFLDACRAYEWLLEQVPAERILFAGVSSGGGVAVRTMQIAASADEATRRRFFAGTAPTPQPAGSICFGPWVRYTDSEEMKRNILKMMNYDLIVSPSVVDCVMPLMKDIRGEGPDQTPCSDPAEDKVSPLYQPMEGLGPLFISVSQHEACYEEDAQLATKAREAGVDVTLSVRPYMCHVYQLLSCFVPEAQEECLAMWKWGNERLAASG